jgi:hypothetical protein
VPQAKRQLEITLPQLLVGRYANLLSGQDGMAKNRRLSIPPSETFFVEITSNQHSRYAQLPLSLASYRASSANALKAPLVD